MYSSNFLLSAQRDSTCTTITVQDLSQYPLELQDREDMAIALFWTTDNWVTAESDMNPSATDWFIQAINNKTYLFRAYLTALWYSGSVYNAASNGVILEHGGLFYKQVSDAPTGEPGIVGATGWALLNVGEDDPLNPGTPLTIALIKLNFDNSIITNSFDFIYGDAALESNCASVSAIKTGCHSWEITDNTGDAVPKLIVISKYTGEVLDNTIAIQENTVEISSGDYENGDDGVYLIELIEETNGIKTKSYGFTYIFDLCDAEACYLALFKYIKCACSDPCDPDCAQKKGLAQRRADLEIMLAMFQTINALIFVEKYKYLGIAEKNEERTLLIDDVGRMIDQLKIITERCGLCNDVDINDVNC